MISVEDRLHLSQCFNRNVGKIPKMAWNGDVENMFPQKNHYKTLYYKAERLFPAEIFQWIKEIENDFNESLPVYPGKVKIRDSRKCTKCNLAFKSGVRIPCVVRCPCNFGTTPIEIRLCIRCSLVHWLFYGARATENVPIYNTTFKKHPGFCKCSACSYQVTLKDFFRVEI